MVRPCTAYTLRPGGAEFTRRPGNAEANHRHWQLTAADIYDEVLQWPTGLREDARTPPDQRQESTFLGFSKRMPG